jgi:hypothetical protein
MAGEVGSPPVRTVHSRVRSSSLAIHADRICALGSSSMMVFHILAKLLCDRRSRARSSRRRLIRGHRVHHTRPIGLALDTLDP